MMWWPCFCCESRCACEHRERELVHWMRGFPSIAAVAGAAPVERMVMGIAAGASLSVKVPAAVPRVTRA